MRDLYMIKGDVLDVNMQIEDGNPLIAEKLLLSPATLKVAFANGDTVTICLPMPFYIRTTPVEDDYLSHWNIATMPAEELLRLRRSLQRRFAKQRAAILSMKE